MHRRPHRLLPPLSEDWTGCVAVVAHPDDGRVRPLGRRRLLDWQGTQVKHRIVTYGQAGMALQHHVRDPPHRPDVPLTSPTAAARGEVNMADHRAVGLVVHDAVRPPLTAGRSPTLNSRDGPVYRWWH